MSVFIKESTSPLTIRVNGTCPQEAAMATFAALDDDAWEGGRIMRTEGLSKSEMNGLLVELETQKNVGTENLRWQCILLSGKEERLSIKPVNLCNPPTPTVEENDVANQLVEEHLKLCSVKEWALAQEKIILALSNIPNSGRLHEKMVVLSDTMGLDRTIMIKHIKRAVANSDGSDADASRLFPARINYAGLLASGGDFNAAQIQLEKLLHNPTPPADCCKLIPTVMIIYADTLRLTNKFDEALAVLRRVDSMPRPLHNERFNVEEELKRIFAQLSYALYQLAIAAESRAEEVGGVAESDRTTLLEHAKELLRRSLDVLNDAAGLTAYERVCRKLNPSEPVIINGLLMTTVDGLICAKAIGP